MKNYYFPLWGSSLYKTQKQSSKHSAVAMVILNDPYIYLKYSVLKLSASQATCALSVQRSIFPLN